MALAEFTLAHVSAVAPLYLKKYILNLNYLSEAVQHLGQLRRVDRLHGDLDHGLGVEFQRTEDVELLVRGDQIRDRGRLHNRLVDPFD